MSAPSQPPGLNPLFLGVLGALSVGVLAAALAGDAVLLKSNLVFRVAVGGAVAAVAYASVMALWLAWQRKTLARLGFAGTGVEAPKDEAIADEVRARDLEIAEFMGATTKAIEELERRVAALERPR